MSGTSESSGAPTPRAARPRAPQGPARRKAPRCKAPRCKAPPADRPMTQPDVPHGARVDCGRTAACRR
jgi:hypothetical protein